MTHTFTLIPGDGIGPEVSAAVVRILQTALLLAAVLMLRHIGETPRVDLISTALDRVMTAGHVRTRDLGGDATTTSFTDAICREIETLR